MTRRDSFLTVPMREREQTHRRLVLWGIGALLLLSLSPVIGHHLSSQVDAALMGQDHLWDICLIAVHTLLAPVHGLFHVLLIAGLLYATADRARAVWRLRRTLAMLTPSVGAPGSRIDAAMRQLGLGGGTVYVVDGVPNPAFTAGWWAPRIYLAREIGELLSPEQLIAVLAHEAEHVRRRDPLRLSLLRFLGCTLFWNPAFRRLASDMADEAEISADDVAARGAPLVLASAILLLAAWRSPAASEGGPHAIPAGAVVGLVENGSRRKARFDALLDRRVRRLAGQTVVVSTHLTRRSILAAAAMLALVWISGVAVAHPMPTAGAHADAAHCDHPGEGALSHLFCRGTPFSRATSVVGASRCPHAHPAS